MDIIADLQLHSRFSRACSKSIDLENLEKYARIKGLNLLTTGDFQHPIWNKEIKKNLGEDENGVLWSKTKFPFIWGTEISLMYSDNGRRAVHLLLFSPNGEVSDQIIDVLGRRGRLDYDGRPIFGMSCPEFVEIMKEVSEKTEIIPAHCMTSFFGVFGSKSGFDSLEECFDELTPNIFAIETGLSSDPLMNWRISNLDKITLISNSDAHSPEKLAREGNLLDTQLSYDGIFGAFKRKKGCKLLKTLEFFPEEGKYHVDGHRKCKVSMSPEETIKRKGLCPECEKPVTVGVLHRIAKLADRKNPKKPEQAADYEHIVPLKEVIGQTLQVGASSRRVDAQYHQLLSLFGNEFYILRELPVKQLEKEGYPLLALALNRMRQGKADVSPGYDGEYGVISLLKEKDFVPTGQLALL